MIARAASLQCWSWAASVMRRFYLPAMTARSGPKRCSQNIQKNRSRTTVAEPIWGNASGTAFYRGSGRPFRARPVPPGANLHQRACAAAKGPPLTPVSSHDGKVVAANLLEGNRHRPDYRGVPSVAVTLPPIAAVGMSEAAARAAGLTFRVNSQKVPDWYTARRVGETVYGYKTLIEEGSGRILGAHLVGPHVDEGNNLLALAIRRDPTAEDLQQAIFGYPTRASEIGYMLSRRGQ